MDHKQLCNILSQRVERPTEDIDALIEGLAVALRQTASEMDSLAIPSFGTFVPVKHLEQIVDDLSTGKRLLLPPQIELTFQPGGKLSHRVNPSEKVI